MVIRGVGRLCSGVLITYKRIRYCEVMPEIVFDALVPEAEIPALYQRFEQLAAAMHVTVSVSDEVTVTEDVERQLREQLEDEAPDRRVVRFSIHAASNLNQTAMTFARLLTPHADLPPEPTALENEEAFEVAAVYPWTVVIVP
ncbi:hypothetical protein CKALI_07305 [Corynebacterium kalinowskii]|uniref:Uncharacterized protein n=2 Tax=Corynebacterium kalinowskii TaxID=2675216 RepID=A0A6B8VDS5_9CORY|nr:hypothetical protein CKALI_07305 [Corynebacterium kalinowskii]